MTLNDLLEQEDIDPKCVFVLRHRPHEPGLRKVLPWLAAEKPEVFNAYQQTQVERLEKSMSKTIGTGHVASFIGHEPGKALFVGLYSIAAARPLTVEQLYAIPPYREVKAYGLTEETRSSVLWFDLTDTEVYVGWKGRLVIGWPPPELSWWRRAHRNSFPVLAIREDSALDAAMPEWNQIDLTWEELCILPARWKMALSEWRAIYYIFDTSDGKAYVGSAYGRDNLLGRWQNYAASGHGGNRLLRTRDPRNFRFTILQRVSPDMDASEVTRLEGTWKDRLHTRSPSGLNNN